MYDRLDDGHDVADRGRRLVYRLEDGWGGILRDTRMSGVMAADTTISSSFTPQSQLPHGEAWRAREYPIYPTLDVNFTNELMNAYTRVVRLKRTRSTLAYSGR